MEASKSKTRTYTVEYGGGRWVLVAKNKWGEIMWAQWDVNEADPWDGK